MSRPIKTSVVLSVLLGCASADKAEDTGEEPETSSPDSIDLDGDGVTADSDCDDSLASVYPGAEELCDGLDNDCDLEVDEGLESVAYQDLDGDGFGDPDASIETCMLTEGYVWVSGDCDDVDSEVYPGREEICDGLDNDCNQEVDEGLKSDWYSDADADGFGDDATLVSPCEAPEGTVDVGGDCNDASSAAWPGATEICDELDNDCDGEVDEEVALVWYKDHDQDGYGENEEFTYACTVPVGYAESAGDCDDLDASAFPGGTEACDEVDNDCDGQVDEADAIDALIWHLDSDGDGYGIETVTTVSCSEPSGYVLPTSIFDCDDARPDFYPGASEICDTKDNDCDGSVDESEAIDATEWYPDADFDSYGEAGYGVTSCSRPSGYVDNDQDCNDGNSDVHPGAFETCDEIDNDCDGSVDDDDPDILDAQSWYLDDDGDGFGDASSSLEACEQPSLYVSNQWDCDDTDGDTYPGAEELCDSLDNNCNSTIDDGVLGTGSACPASNCMEVLASNSAAESGSYWLDSGENECEMDTDGGGWTLLKELAPLYSLTYTENIYNEDGTYGWSEVWFQYNIGSLEAECIYPSEMATCNPIAFRFGEEDWGYPALSGGEDCGEPFVSYETLTTYPSSDSSDFGVQRSPSSDSIEVGTIEGVSACSLTDNGGIAHVDIWIR